MDWQAVFKFANLFAMLAWAVLIFGPRREALYSILFDGVVGLFSLFYAALLAYLLFIAPSTNGGGPDFTTVEGVRAAFAADAGLTLGWVHYLAFDLFVGLWIARNADEISLSRLAQAPILLATFIFGPFGLAIYLIVRRIHGARRAA